MVYIIVKDISTNKCQKKPIKILQKLKLKYNYRQNLQLYAVGFRSLICFSKCQYFWICYEQHSVLGYLQNRVHVYHIKKYWFRVRDCILSMQEEGRGFLQGPWNTLAKSWLAMKNFWNFLVVHKIFFSCSFLILNFSKFIWKSNWFWAKNVRTSHQEPLT